MTHEDDKVQASLMRGANVTVIKTTIAHVLHEKPGAVLTQIPSGTVGCVVAWRPVICPKYNRWKDDFMMLKKIQYALRFPYPFDKFTYYVDAEALDL